MAGPAVVKTLISHASALKGLAAIILSLSSASASAATISLFPVDKDVTGVVVIGAITQGDAAKLRTMAPADKRVIVMLESEGGNLPEALAMGEYIRSKHFATMVINDSGCNSACALIWLAGAPRSLSRSAQVGFHAAYTMGDGGDARENGAANALVGRYLTLLNLPESAVLFATTAPPDELNYLTAFNYEAVGINTNVVHDIDTEPQAKAASNSTPSKPDINLWKDTGVWKVETDHTLDDNCFLAAKFDDSTSFRVGVEDITKSQFYVIMLNPKWQSLKDNQSYKINLEFDNFGAWSFPAIAGSLDDEPALYGKFANLQFWAEFIKAKVLQITTEGKPVTKLSLSGSNEAFQELGRCQRHQNAHKQGDPFAK